MTNGQVGEAPDWYPIIHAAKYLGVPPWELVEREDGRYWTDWALDSEGAEEEAKQALAKQQQLRKGPRR